MAKYNNTIHYNITTSLNSSGLTKLQQELSKTAQQLSIISTQTPAAGAQSQAYQKAAASVKSFQQALVSAYNFKTNTVGLDKLNQQLRVSGTNLKEVGSSMLKAGAQGEAAFAQTLGTLGKMEVKTKTLSVGMQKVMTTLGNTVRWGLIASAFQSVMNFAHQTVQYMEDLDKSLTNIRIVSNYSADEMQRFAENATKAAKALGSTTVAYTDAALIFAQQGFNLQESEKLAAMTIKVANTTGQTTSEVSEQITSWMNGYHLQMDELQSTLDAVTKVAAVSAADTEEIMTAASKVASTASIVGVSTDELISQMSTIISVTREAPENVGNSLKTIYSRLGSLQMGETLEDGVTLTRINESLSTMGVEVLDANGDLRDMGKILEDLMNKWDDLSRAQQMAASTALAGRFQLNRFMTLMDNKEYYDDMMAEAGASSGFLDRTQDIYMQSVEAKKEQLKASAQSIITNMFDTDDFNKILDVVNDLVSAFGTMAGALDGITPKLALMSTLVLKIGKEKIAGSILGMQDKNVQNRVKATNEQLRPQLTNQFMSGAAGTKTVSPLTQAVMDYMQIEQAQIKTNAQAERQNNILQESVKLIQQSVEVYAAEEKALTQCLILAEAYGVKIKNVEEILPKMQKILQDINLGEIASEATAEQIQTIINGMVETLSTVANETLEIANGFKTSANAEEKIIALTEDERQRIKNVVKDIKMQGVLTEDLQGSLEKIQALNKKDTLSKEEQITLMEELLSLSNKLQSKQQQIADIDAKNLKAASAKTEYQQRTRDSAAQKQTSDAAIKNLTNAPRQTAKENKIMAISSGLGNITQAYMGLSFVMDGFKTLRDDAASCEEKMSALFLSVGMGATMLAPTIVNLTKTLGNFMNGLKAAAPIQALMNAEMLKGATATKLKTAADWENLTYNEKSNAIKALGIVIEGARTEAALDAAFAEKMENLTKKEQIALMRSSIALRLKEIGVKIANKVADLEAIAASKLVVLFTKLTTAEKNLETNAFMRNTRAKILHKAATLASKAAMAGLIPIILAAIAAIALLTIGIVAFIRSGYNFSRALEDAKEKTAAAATAADKAKESYDALCDSLDAIAEQRTNLNSMTEGTAEWAAAVADLNNKMLDLISTYHLQEGVDWTTDENGVMQLMPGAEEKIKQQEARKLNEANLVYAEAKANENEAQLLANVEGEGIRSDARVREIASAARDRNAEYDDKWKNWGVTEEEFNQMRSEYLANASATNAAKRSAVEGMVLETVEKSGYTGVDARNVSRTAASIIDNDALIAKGLNDSVKQQLGLQGYVVDDDMGIGQYNAEGKFESVDLDLALKSLITKQDVLDQYGGDKVKDGKILDSEGNEIIDYAVAQEQLINDLYKTDAAVQAAGEAYAAVKDTDFMLQREGVSQANAQAVQEAILSGSDKGIDLSGIDLSAIQDQIDATKDPEELLTLLGLDETAIQELGYKDAASFAAAFKEGLENQEPVSIESLIEQEEAHDASVHAANLNENEMDEVDFENYVETFEDKNINFKNKRTEIEDKQQAALDNDNVEEGKKAYAEATKELEEYEKALRDAADRELQLQRAGKKLNQTFEDSGDILRNKAGKGTVEYSKALGELKEGLSEVFDVDASEFSNEFIEDNLDLIERAAAGEQDALDSLYDSYAASRIQAFGNLEDITTEEVQKVKNIVNSQDWGNIEIGTNLADVSTEAQAVLDALVAQFGWGSDQVQAYLDAINFEPDVGTEEYVLSGREKLQLAQLGSITVGDEETEITSSDTYTNAEGQTVVSIPTFNGAKAKGAPSARALASGGGSKGGGGGGGGGGGSKKTATAKSGSKRSATKAIDKKIEKNTKELNKLQKEEAKVIGKDLVGALEKENDLIEKNVKLEKEKLKTLKDEKKELLTDSISYIKTDAAGNQTEVSVKIPVNLEDEGAFTNWYNIQFDKLEQLRKRYNKTNSEADKAAYENQKAYLDAVDQRKEDVDSKNEEIEESEENIADCIEQQLENLIKEFETMADMTDKIKDLESMWNEFTNQFNDVSDPFGAGRDNPIREFNTAMGEAQINTKTLSSDMEVLRGFLSGAFDDIFGDDEAAKIEAFDEALQDVVGDIQNIDDAYAQLKDSTQELMDMQDEYIDYFISSYENMNSSIDTQIESVKLLQGEKAYGAINELLEQKIANDKISINITKQEIEALKLRLSLYEEGSNEWKETHLQIQETTEALEELQNQATKDAQDLRAISVAEATSDFISSLFGQDFEWTKQQWEMANKQAEFYLDEAAKTYNIQKLQGKYIELLNKTTPVSIQKQITEQMQKQLDALRQKEKLTQYDLDAAQARYDLLVAEIALEDARNNKSTLSLRRDSQGNYSYAYVQNDAETAKAEADYLDAAYKVVTTDLDATKNAQDNALSAVEDLISSLEELSANQDIDDETRNQRLVEILNSSLIQDILDQYAEALANLGLSTDEYFGLVEDENISSSLKDVVSSFLGGDKSNLGLLVNLLKIGADGELDFNTFKEQIKKSWEDTAGDIYTQDAEIERYRNEAQATVRSQYTTFEQDLIDQNEKISNQIDIIIEAAKTMAALLAANGGDIKAAKEALQKYFEERQTTPADIAHAAGGGYTGVWGGGGGKLAILHSNELVLNSDQTDTVLRLAQLAADTFTMNGIISSSLSSPSSLGQVLDQQVNIEAVFPNASDAGEIREALMGLVNRAAQFATDKTNMGNFVK